MALSSYTVQKWSIPNTSDKLALPKNQPSLSANLSRREASLHAVNDNLGTAQSATRRQAGKTGQQFPSLQ
jgi:hypothetical protein